MPGNKLRRDFPFQVLKMFVFEIEPKLFILRLRSRLVFKLYQYYYLGFSGLVVSFLGHYYKMIYTGYVGARILDERVEIMISVDNPVWIGQPVVKPRRSCVW